MRKRDVRLNQCDCAEAIIYIQGQRLLLLVWGHIIGRTALQG
jgi:hypothetical protein